MTAPLQPALDAMREAARREGIEPGTPLGEWVQAVEALATAFGTSLAGVAADARATAEANAERARSAVAIAEAAARKAEAGVKHLEVRTEQLQTETIEKLVPAVAEALGGLLVIRERRRNHFVLGGWAAALAALALVLFGSGYAARARADRPALELRDRCLRAAVRDPAGKLYCPLEALRDHVANKQRSTGR